MSEEIKAGRCLAMTKSGQRCKNRSQANSNYCYQHKAFDVDEAAEKSNNIESDQEILRSELIEEIEELVARVKGMEPGYEPPSWAEDGAKKKPMGSSSGMIGKIRSVIREGLLEPETWKGMWYMLNHTVEYQGDMVRRRFKGDYETDEWGMDWEFLELIRPMLDFLYKVYWRVECTGIENIPDYDKSLMVSNYSGELPWDSLMIMTSVLSEHPAQRLVRSLYPEWLPTLPFLSSALVKMGQTLATMDNGLKLLHQDELVCVYPESGRQFSKVYRDRYELKRFGSSDFIRMALLTRSPLIPVSVVGAEESYVSLAQIPMPEELDGFPHLPITLRFPWLGLLGTLPYPSKWYIDLGEPIPLDKYEPADADDPVLVSRLADSTRDVIQGMINDRLARRRSVFY